MNETKPAPTDEHRKPSIVPASESNGSTTMETAMSRTRLSNIGPIGIYGLLLGWIFRDALRSMSVHWSDPDYSYAYLLPLLIGYLVWEKREELRSVPVTASWWGTAAVICGMAVYWFGELAGEFYTLYLAFFLTVLGMIWQHVGTDRFRRIAFPLLLVISIFPLPSFLQTRISLKLQLLSSQLGVWFLQLFGTPAYREGNVIDLGFTQLQVIESCSGLRYLIPLGLLGLVLAYLLGASFWKRALLALSTVPIAIFLNGLRIAATGLLYQYLGQRAAEGFFHDFSGWVIFMTALGMVLVEMAVLKRLPPRKEVVVGASHQKDRGGGPQRSRWSRPGLLARQPQFWVALAVLVVTAASSPAVSFQQETPILKPLSQFPLQIGAWSGTRQTLEQRFIDALDFSDYVIIDYQDGQGHRVEFYTAYYASQRKGESIHSPETCLPGGGWAFEDESVITLPVADPDCPQVALKRVVLEKLGHKQLAYFWFQMRGRFLVNAYQVKFYNFWDALTRHRTDGALVRLVTPISPEETIMGADRRLRQFVGHVLPVLNRFMPGRDPRGANR